MRMEGFCTVKYLNSNCTIIQIYLILTLTKCIEMKRLVPVSRFKEFLTIAFILRNLVFTLQEGRTQVELCSDKKFVR